MRTLVIEKSALKNNLSVIKERAAGAVIYANLSGDGGGLGTVPLARLLRDDGIVRFAVTEISQAEALRREGFVEEEILMLRSTTDREELEDDAYTLVASGWTTLDNMVIDYAGDYLAA